MCYKEYQNENDFHVSKNSLCKICGAVSTYKICPPRKYVANKQSSKAHIFNDENHTCKAKNSSQRPLTIVEFAVAVDTTTPTSSI